MALDPSIALQVRGAQIESPLDAQTKALTLRDLMGRSQLQDVQVQQAQQQQVQQQALQAAYANGTNADGTVDMGRVLQHLAANGGGAAVPGVLKTQVEQRKSLADLGKVDAETGKLKTETAGMNAEQAFAAHTRALQGLGAVSSPDQMQQWTVDGVRTGALTPENAVGLSQQLAANPTDFPQLKQQLMLSGMELAKQLEATKAAPTTLNTGKQTLTRDMNPMSPTFGQQIAAAVQMQTTPGEDLSSRTSLATNAATNATHLKGIGMTQAAENLRAGLGQNGQPDQNFELTAQAIANGQMPPPGGMALTNPRNQRLLGRVMEINPQYDYTTTAAKKTAAAAFTTGQQGNALRSFAVAGQHLDQLGQLADALGNGNTQIVNKVGQAIAQQTGSEAPTNFDAAKNVVAKEVMKAIVAGGGGQAEREELAQSLSRASSPAQLKGVIAQYRNLMGAQQENLLAQRRAAGLPDSTLPSYAAPAPAAAARGAAVPIKSDADYNALPSGTRFLAPDGSTRVKP